MTFWIHLRLRAMLLITVRTRRQDSVIHIIIVKAMTVEAIKKLHRLTSRQRLIAVSLPTMKSSTLICIAQSL